MGARNPEAILNALSLSTGIKRKAKNNNAANKQPRIEKYYIKECIDKEGFEQEYSRMAQGRADVSIDKLHVDEDFGLPINEALVNKLAADFLLRPDPTMFTLTVVPRDLDKFDIEEAEGHSYTVIHGRHR